MTIRTGIPVELGSRRGSSLRSANPGSSGFSPTQVSGLVAWYDFSDATTLFTDTGRTTAVSADGDSIKGVSDKSGNGYHLSEATSPPAYKVNILNGESVCRLGDSATKTILSGSGLPARTAQTVFCVHVKRAAIDNFVRVVWSTGNRSGIHTYQTVSATAYLWNADETVTSRSVGFGNATTWQITSMTTPSAASMTWRTGGGAATATFDPHDGIATNTLARLGYDNQSGVNYGDFDVAEWIIYDSVLSSADHDSVGEYLSAKFNIAWTAVS